MLTHIGSIAVYFKLSVLVKVPVEQVVRIIEASAL